MTVLKCLFFIGLLGFNGIAAANDNAGALTVGIIPQQSAVKIIKTWTPLVQYLENKTGYPVRIAASPDIPTFEKRLFSGQFDMVYINPKLYVDASRLVGYIAIAREKEKKLRGIIVVKKDSAYKSLSDLDGKLLVFPDNAFAASVIPRLNLTKQNINYSVNYVATHDQAYWFVAEGKMEAAGGVLRTLSKTPRQVQSKLRIIWSSDSFTPHAFAMHPRVDPNVRDRLKQALLSYYESDTGKINLDQLGFNMLVDARDSDWDDIRKLIGSHP